MSSKMDANGIPPMLAPTRNELKIEVDKLVQTLGCVPTVGSPRSSSWFKDFRNLDPEYVSGWCGNGFESLTRSHFCWHTTSW